MDFYRLFLSLFFVCWQGNIYPGSPADTFSFADSRAMRNSPESTDVCTALFKSDIFCVAPNSWALKIDLPILNIDIRIVYERNFSKDTWAGTQSWSQFAIFMPGASLETHDDIVFFCAVVWKPFLNTIIWVALGIPKMCLKCDFTPHFWK